MGRPIIIKSLTKTSPTMNELPTQTNNTKNHPSFVKHSTLNIRRNMQRNEKIICSCWLPNPFFIIGFKAKSINTTQTTSSLKHCISNSKSHWLSLMKQLTVASKSKQKSEFRQEGFGENGMSRRKLKTHSSYHARRSQNLPFPINLYKHIIFFHQDSSRNSAAQVFCY